MNDKYKKKYLKYKKKYLQFKQLRGGMDEEEDLELEIDLAGGLFFALSSSLFLDKFSLQPGVDYSLKIKDITDYFNAELGKMKAWHTSTAGRTKTGGREERAEILGFPWNNEQTMIQIFGEKFSVLSNAKILELLIDECNEIGDLDTKLHMNLSDEDIIGALSGQEFPSYAAMFFLAREKCGDFNIDEILAFLKKKGEKTDLGASVLDRTFLSKLIHSNKHVLQKICWELIFIILKNEPGKIEKRMRRFIIFYFIFEKNKNIFTINSIDELLDMCISHRSPNNWDAMPQLFPDPKKPPPALLSATTLGTKINAQVGVINTTVANLDAFDRTNTESGESGWTWWKKLKAQNFPHIFPEILDSNAEDFIRKKLGTVEGGKWVDFAIYGFQGIKQLIKDQTTLNSLLLTSFNGFGGNGLPYQNLAQNIKIILAKMNKFLKEGGSTVPTVQLIPLNFINKDDHISIARAIKNVIINLATDHDGADVDHGALLIDPYWVPRRDPGDGQIKWGNTVTHETSEVKPSVKWIGPDIDPKDGQTKWKNKETGKETIQKPIASMVNLNKYMKQFYIKRLNLTEPIKGPSGFSWARVQVPMNLENITPELMEEIALLKLSINKLTTKNPSRQNITNITDAEVVKVLTELGYGIPDMSLMSQEQATQILAGWLQTEMKGEAEILMQNMGYTGKEQNSMLQLLEHMNYTDEEQNTMLQLLEQVTANDSFSPEDQIAMLRQWVGRHTPLQQIIILHLILLDYTRDEQNTMLAALTKSGYNPEHLNTIFQLLEQAPAKGLPRDQQITLFQQWADFYTPLQQIVILQLILLGYTPEYLNTMVQELTKGGYTRDQQMVILQMVRLGWTREKLYTMLQEMTVASYTRDHQIEMLQLLKQVALWDYTPEHLNIMLHEMKNLGYTREKQIEMLQLWARDGSVPYDPSDLPLMNKGPRITASRKDGRLP